MPHAHELRPRGHAASSDRLRAGGHRRGDARELARMIGNRAFCRLIARDPPITRTDRQLPGGLPKDAQMVDLDTVEYTQPGISFSTRDKQTVGKMAAWMLKYGWRLSEPADMVKMKDGRLVSLDHRRLWAAARAGIKQVSARVHEEGDKLSAPAARRFAIGKDEVPKGTNPVTNANWKAGDKPERWGDAVRFRSAVQGFGKAGEATNQGYDPATLAGGGGTRDPKFPAAGSKDPPMRMQPGKFEPGIDPTANASVIKSGGQRKNVQTGKIVQGSADSGPATPPPRPVGGGPSVEVDPSLHGGGPGRGSVKSRSMEDDEAGDITGDEVEATSGVSHSPSLTGMIMNKLFKHWFGDGQKALDAALTKRFNEDLQRQLNALAYLSIGIQTRGDVAYAQITIEHTSGSMTLNSDPISVFDLKGVRISEWFREDHDSSSFEGVSTVTETKSVALPLHPMVLNSWVSALTEQMASAASEGQRDRLRRCIERLKKRGPTAPSFSSVGGDCLDLLPMGTQPPAG